MVELGSKASVCHFVERLAEIQKNSDNLLSLVQSVGQVMNCYYELRLTRPSLSEAMLLITKDVMTIKVLHETAVDYVFHGLSISNGFVSSKIYDKRDDFDFDIVNFPFLDGDLPRRPSYGVYISQLIRFARVCSHVDDFNSRNK